MIARREFLKATLAASGGLALAPLSLSGGASRAAAPAGARPNIIFYFCDDLGWGDLGCQGNPVIQTPRLDQFAAESCRFTDFYATAPVCGPSRAGAMTGRIQNRFGMEWLCNHTFQPTMPMYHHVPLEEPMLPRLLQQAGYRTGHIGKWHLSLLEFEGEPFPPEYGFDYYFIVEGVGGKSFYANPTDWYRNGETIPGRLADWAETMYVDEAIRFIEEKPGVPFFLNLWTFTPHEPLASPQSYQELYPDRMPEEKVYFGAVTQMDAQFGRLMDYLQRAGLAENTIVIFSSDNGPEHYAALDNRICRGSSGPFRAGKRRLYEGGIRVPGIIRWPGVTTAGSVSHEPASTVDLLPTLCKAAGAALPTEITFDGADLRPLLAGDSAVERPHPLFWRMFDADRPYFRHSAYPSPPLAMRRGRWKILSDFEYAKPELYSLDIDIGEQWNVAERYPEVTAELMGELRRIHEDVIQPYPSERYLNPHVVETVPRVKPSA